MTAYETWTIGGKTISHVADVKKNQRDGIITLTCHSFLENALTGDTDPRDEIAYFEAMQTRDITNEPLLSGGSKLQARNIIEVTDGHDTWTRCALEPVEISEDMLSKDVITYNLNIHYELAGTSGSIVYTPNYYDYNNIEYYMWSDKTNPTPPHEAYGNEIGWMEITEEENVKKVEMFGNGCCSTEASPVWVSVNDDKFYWHYTSNQDEGEGNILNYGVEKATFTIDPPTNVITITTSTHTNPATTCLTNQGCWLQWVKNTFE
jgi:hypothetical protein